MDDHKDSSIKIAELQQNKEDAERNIPGSRIWIRVGGGNKDLKHKVLEKALKSLVPEEHKEKIKELKEKILNTKFCYEEDVDQYRENLKYLGLEEPKETRELKGLEDPNETKEEKIKRLDEEIRKKSEERFSLLGITFRNRLNHFGYGGTYLGKDFVPRYVKSNFIGDKSKEELLKIIDTQTKRLRDVDNAYQTVCRSTEEIKKWKLIDRHQTKINCLRSEIDFLNDAVEFNRNLNNMRFKKEILNIIGDMDADEYDKVKELKEIDELVKDSITGEERETQRNIIDSDDNE